METVDFGRYEDIQTGTTPDGDRVFSVYETGAPDPIGTYTLPAGVELADLAEQRDAGIRRVVADVVGTAILSADRRVYGSRSLVALVPESAMTAPIRAAYYELKTALFAYLDAVAHSWTFEQFAASSHFPAACLLRGSARDVLDLARRQFIAMYIPAGLDMTEPEFLAALAAMTPEQREAL